MIVSCTKEEETSDPNYPTTISKLSTEDYNQLLIDLSETSLYQCTSIDSFGHCYVSLKNDECGVFDSIYVDYTLEELTQIFYESILKYGNFINTSDTAGIKISSVKNHKSLDFESFNEANPDSATEGWIITSSLQTLNGYSIPGTEIKVDVFFDQIRSIEGKRYTNLYLPATDVYSEAQAKEILMDNEYTYSSSTIKITETTSWYDSQKIIFPITKAETIELRVCWALHPENWLIVVDTQTGEVLTSVEL